MFSPSLGFVLLFVANPQKSSLFYQVTRYWIGVASYEQLLTKTFELIAKKMGVL